MDQPTLRLLDANFNRAREALRVLEDYARFLLDDPSLTQTAKQLRHDLSQTIAQLPVLELLAARDTPGDVGTSLTTPTEQSRTDALAVVQAAAKRLPEALRCLEEYTKIDRPDLAARIESIRYQGYELEKQILSRAHRRDRFSAIRLYVILTESLANRPLLEVAEQVLAGGADCLQLREKDKSDSELLELAGSLRTLCRDAGALFIVNDRPDLALLADADGLHLGQNDLSVTQARKILKPHMLVGKSSHNLPEAESALAEHPDYLAVGSIFPSPTKPNVATPGPDLIVQIRQNYPGPLVAIGGITTQNAHLALTAGASALAVCSAVIAAGAPQSTARAFKDILSAITPPCESSPGNQNANG
jgi:thiamine-phosphate pyrophosphorylase